MLLDTMLRTENSLYGDQSNYEQLMMCQFIAFPSVLHYFSQNVEVLLKKNPTGYFLMVAEVADESGFMQWEGVIIWFLFRWSSENLVCCVLKH